MGVFVLASLHLPLALSATTQMTIAWMKTFSYTERLSIVHDLFEYLAQSMHAELIAQLLLLFGEL